MNTDPEIASAKRSLDEIERIVEKKKAEFKQMQKERKRMDTELPRKVIADMLGVSGSTVYRLRERGELKSYKMNDVFEYLTNNP